ncbi:unnamed protein product [marine sediment metagenome]|uniref:Uncharacterized protein n=1 Tax=marine sediment metagenome TaxID=412755 RepID=X1GM14_9ZZZZ
MKFFNYLCCFKRMIEYMYTNNHHNDEVHYQFIYELNRLDKKKELYARLFPKGNKTISKGEKQNEK